MNINVTLFAQMLVFAALIWFSMKFVWPMVLGAMQEREQRIAHGLAAAERGLVAEGEAQANADATLRTAREKAAQIVAQAEKQAHGLLDQAKEQAAEESERLVQAARAQIEQESIHAREELRGRLAGLAVAGAAKILGREIDAAAHERVLHDLVAQL